MTVLFDNFCPGPLWSFSWSETLYFILHTKSKLVDTKQSPCRTSIGGAGRVVVGAIRRRAVLGNDRDVVLVLDFSVKRRRRSYHSRLAVDAELVVVAADCLDTIRHLQVANNAVMDYCRLRPRCCHLGSHFKCAKRSPVRPLACNSYYCAQFIAKPKAACTLRFSWAATSSKFGLRANTTSSIKRKYITYHYAARGGLSHGCRQHA